MFNVFVKILHEDIGGRLKVWTHNNYFQTHFPPTIIGLFSVPSQVGILTYIHTSFMQHKTLRLQLKFAADISHMHSTALIQGP